MWTRGKNSGNAFCWQGRPSCGSSRASSCGAGRRAAALLGKMRIDGRRQELGSRWGMELLQAGTPRAGCSRMLQHREEMLSYQQGLESHCGHLSQFPSLSFQPFHYPIPRHILKAFSQHIAPCSSPPFLHIHRSHHPS